MMKSYKIHKNDEASLVKVKVKNTSNKIWNDTASNNQHEHGCVEVEPYLISDLDNRYFVIERKNANNQWHNLFRKMNQTCLLQGKRAKFEFFLKAKTYSPAGLHKLKIGVREKISKKELSSKTEPISVNVIIQYKLDKRMASLKNIGEIEYKYTNNLYNQLQPNSKHVAVIMAVWKRIERLNISIEAFEKQKGVIPVLHLWVNNREVDDQVKQIVGKAKIPVVVYFSENNIGGFGRFYLARDINNKYDKVIFVDDDQVPEPEAFITMLNEHKADTILGVYAMQMPLVNDYWYRREIKPGEEADYIGTCGMICSTSIFDDDKLFDCPKRYWFIEDLWLCYFAYKFKGWKLIKSSADIIAIDDKKDQFRIMIDLKNEFFKYLVKKGLGTHS